MCYPCPHRNLLAQLFAGQIAFTLKFDQIRDCSVTISRRRFGGGSHNPVEPYASGLSRNGSWSHRLLCPVALT